MLLGLWLSSNSALTSNCNSNQKCPQKRYYYVNNTLNPCSTCRSYDPPANKYSALSAMSFSLFSVLILRWPRVDIGYYPIPARGPVSGRGSRPRSPFPRADPARGIHFRGRIPRADPAGGSRGRIPRADPGGGSRARGLFPPAEKEQQLHLKKNILLYIIPIQANTGNAFQSFQTFDQVSIEHVICV